MKQLPPMTIKTWKGTLDERFTHIDMNRIKTNLNVISEFCGVPKISFRETTRASQFDYSEYQDIENRIRLIGNKIRVPVKIETRWAHGRTVSYADFDRVEKNIHALYKAQGGASERIPWDTELIILDWVLDAAGWAGNGPYTYVLESPMIHAADDMVAYISEGSSVEEKAAEANAVLTVSCVQDGRVTVTALAKKPKTDLHIRINTRVFRMKELKTLTTTGWQGSGPWTQTITTSGNVATGLVAQPDRMTEEQAKSFTRGMLSIASANGRSVTIRAMGKKPTVNLPVMILYETSEGA